MSNEKFDAAGEMLSAFPDVCADPGEEKMDAFDWDADASTWKLTDQAKQYRDRCVAELRALQASQEAELAAAKAEGEKLKTRLFEMNRDAALRKTLTKGGCDLKLLAGAVAHLQSEWKFADQDGQVIAIVDGMQRDVGEAVASWLADEESGAAFKAAKRGELGAFASRIIRT